MAADRNDALDGLRGIAIICVVLRHAGYFTGGYLGVDLFFVLSGFLITGILLREHRNGGIDLLSFYRRRALRILPPLFFFIAFYLIVSALFLPSWQRMFDDAVSALSFTINWTRAFEVPGAYYLGHLWSLAIEEQFYLLWPVTILVLLRYGSNENRALWMIGCLIAACALWRGYLAYHHVSVARTYNGFDTRCDALLVGCFIALLSDPTRRALAKFWPAYLAGIAAFMAFTDYRDDVMPYGGYTLFALCAGGLIISAVNGTRIALPLAWPPLVGVGLISYALYIWHYPVLYVLYEEAKLSYHVSNIGIPIAVAASIASYYWVERPILSRRYDGSPESHQVVGFVSLLSMLAALIGGAAYFFVAR